MPRRQGCYECVKIAKKPGCSINVPLTERTDSWHLKWIGKGKKPSAVVSEKSPKGSAQEEDVPMDEESQETSKKDSGVQDKEMTEGQDLSKFLLYYKYIITNRELSA